MAAHVRRINAQDKAATVVLTLIVGFVLLILAAIVVYVLLASGAGKLFDLGLSDGQAQQFKEGGGIGPQLFNSFYLLVLTLLISVPISLGAAIFLAEYAPDNRATAIAEDPSSRRCRLCRPSWWACSGFCSSCCIWDGASPSSRARWRSPCSTCPSSCA